MDNKAQICYKKPCFDSSNHNKKTFLLDGYNSLRDFSHFSGYLESYLTSTPTFDQHFSFSDGYLPNFAGFSAFLLQH